MDVQAILDDVRASLPGCSAVAFVDMSSDMVLCVSAATRPPQEELEHLTQAASLMLKGTVAEGARPMIGDADDAAGSALVISRDGLTFCRRDPKRPDEAMVIEGEPALDIQKAQEVVGDALSAIAVAD